MDGRTDKTFYRVSCQQLERERKEKKIRGGLKISGEILFCIEDEIDVVKEKNDEIKLNCEFQSMEGGGCVVSTHYS